MKYSECLAEWLVQLGYTHCFYVGGGNIMHLLESLSTRLDCRAVIHEGAAGIAAEYFNETSSKGKALALVTAGPGLTNIITAMAGAYLESRELLVIGGQVKTADLAHGLLRQRGIQEIDGVAIAHPVSVLSERIDEPLDFPALSQRIQASRVGRKGPVFLEIPLDVQARSVAFEVPGGLTSTAPLPTASEVQLDALAARIRQAKRPMFLLGGGVSRETMHSLSRWFTATGIPVGTTWNAADRMDAQCRVYVGRPNTWGQRSANLVLQQSDLLIAVGTRLGMQQTGFNWQQFVPTGQVVQVDLDQAELDKGHPRVDFPMRVDANDLLLRLSNRLLGEHAAWLDYAQGVRQAIPAVEAVNTTREGFVSPYAFVDHLSDLCRDSDVVIPCSSGGAFTVMMQTFRQKQGQLMVTNKGLASMGYGLSGAIGSAFAHPDRRVVLIEGDGGFTQNMQEIGTAAINQLNLKIFIFDDSGYASIRMTQRSYFGGRYVGCDRNTGLGLPDWEKLFAVWDVPALRLAPGYENKPEFLERFTVTGPAAFIVTVDPEQTYFPKILSRITDTGTMESNPLHRMNPELPAALQQQVEKYL